jgi:adenylate kinase
MSSPAADRPGSKLVDLEVKDARIIFTPIWDLLQEEVGRENLRFPKEIILLGGAPGSGKGTQTQFISDTRGLTCPPIVISDLLTTPEMEKIKAQGGMVGDKEVLSVLLRHLLDETYRDGVILDGFPRTPVQVEFLKLLVEQIGALHDEFGHTPLAIHFRRPTIHAMVLFVSESTSVARQLGRGREIAEYNRKVAETGIGTPIDLRATDLSEELVRRRYQVFKEQTWTALTSLRQLYHYHFINAEGPIADVQANILKELKYQSSLELDPRTFERLRALPLAEELVVHGRQELVKRLDSYELDHTELLRQIVELVSGKFMPIITRHALSGRRHRELRGSHFQRAAGDPDVDRHLFGARLSRRRGQNHPAGPGARGPQDRRDQVPHERRLPDPGHVRGLEDPPRLTCSVRLQPDRPNGHGL